MSSVQKRKLIYISEATHSRLSKHCEVKFLKLWPVADAAVNQFMDRIEGSNELQSNGLKSQKTKPVHVKTETHNRLSTYCDNNNFKLWPIADAAISDYLNRVN